MIEKIAKEILDGSCVEAAYLLEENDSLLSVILFSDQWIELKDLNNFTKRFEKDVSGNRHVFLIDATRVSNSYISEILVRGRWIYGEKNLPASTW
ncbi:hypothetical protein CL659_02285 [bacterium]|nr:hypothetical protein [bacterium]|tara:strand:+ start:25718 stop:26002 length:285 start_codon:yes stop_codon:yes gene_type:complete